MGQANIDVIDARSEFTARALIAKMERKLNNFNELERYDVYCEWIVDKGKASEFEVWLSDRSDDSRIGPLPAYAVD